MEFIQLTARSNGLKAHRYKYTYKVLLIIVINPIRHKDIKIYSIYTVHFKIQLIKILLFLIKRFIFLAFFFYDINLFARIQKILSIFPLPNMCLKYTLRFNINFLVISQGLYLFIIIAANIQALFVWFLQTV